MRKAFTVDFRIAVAIYVLKSGCDASVAGDVFKIGRSTVVSMLHEFCKAVNQTLFHEMIQFPTSRDAKISAAKDFCERWQFPDTIGALDGTHIPILAPAVDPNDYFNYKKYHSLVILALVNANCEFTYVNVGRPGGVNDATIFHGCQLKQLICNENEMEDMHIIADGAFPLLKGLMKPYLITAQMSEAKTNFNARLSRARVIVEDAFGRLKGRWRILTKRADYNVPNLIEILKTCLILHNICQKYRDTFDNAWRIDLSEFEKEFPQPDKILRITENVNATQKREMLCDALLSDNIQLVN